jgi:hypothetical protein
MLSVACPEPATSPAPSAAEPPRSAMPFRRIAVSFAAGSRPAPSPRRPQRDQIPTVPLPRYSRIIFRAGSVSVR